MIKGSTGFRAAAPIWNMDVIQTVRVMMRMPSARAASRRNTSPPADNWIAPMLATLTDQPFSHPDWLYERKLDGYRCLAYRIDGQVHLYSRNRHLLDVVFPELVDAFTAQPGQDFVVDGEIVAFAGPQTSFARLQQRAQLSDPEQVRRSRIAVFYYAFDLLRWEGEFITHLPLRTRKQLLRQCLRFGDPIRYTPHRNGAGAAYFELACRRGWEGVIAKRADAPYEQRRSKQWLKFKCAQGQEFVIGGYTDPQGSRIGLGALLLGYYQQGQLHYAGRVGTGFDKALLRRLRQELSSIEQAHSPFVDHRIEPHVHWVRPERIAQVAFTEWTRDGRLRHPRFLGLRDDKPVQSVTRERPQAAGPDE